MPGHIGQELEKAVGELAIEGFAVVVRDVGGTPVARVVIRQSPVPAQPVCIGDTVTLFVAGEPVVDTTTSSVADRPTTSSSPTTQPTTTSAPPTTPTSATTEGTPTTGSSRTSADPSTSAGSSGSAGGGGSTTSSSTSTSTSSSSATTVANGGSTSSVAASDSTASDATTTSSSGAPHGAPSPTTDRPRSDGWPVLAFAGIAAVAGAAGVRRARRRLSFASRPLEVLIVPGSLQSTIESDSFGGAPLRFHLRSDASVEYVESDGPPSARRGGTDER